MPLITPDKICASCGQSSSPLRRTCEHCGHALTTGGVMEAAVVIPESAAVAVPAARAQMQLVNPIAGARLRELPAPAEPAAPRAAVAGAKVALINPAGTAASVAAPKLPSTRLATTAPATHFVGTAGGPDLHASTNVAQKTEPMPAPQAELVQRASAGGAAPGPAAVAKTVVPTQPDPQQVAPRWISPAPGVRAPPPRRRDRVSTSSWIGLALALTTAVAAAFFLEQRAKKDVPPPIVLAVPPMAAVPLQTAAAGLAKTAPNPPTAPLATLDEALRNRLKNATVVVSVRVGEKVISMGSGFFLASDGLIATNHHVITSDTRGTHLSVRLFGASVDEDSVECVADDPRRDLALLRLTGARPAAVLVLHAGDLVPETTPVVVVGHPQGELWSITQGTITGQRDLDGQRFYGTDARIEPGNSGGPVTLRSDGEVIGISDWKIRATSLNYAIPADALADLVRTSGKRAGHACRR
jgi:S1-C subfamily serine protease